MLHDMKVYEAKLNEDSWNIPFLRQYIDEDTIKKIQAILPPPPTDNLRQDRKKWKFTQDENFLVVNAYKALKNDTRVKDWIWNIVWKWQGPEKIKCFTWMATHQELLTAQRRARFFGSDSSCHRCKGVPETIQHAL
ncbi:Putative ribonuclease H protein [Arachis hypogaea]|nr:Putative ribonuclease H protein [Arachis hypogaea]